MSVGKKHGGPGPLPHSHSHSHSHTLSLRSREEQLFVRSPLPLLPLHTLVHIASILELAQDYLLFLEGADRVSDTSTEF